MYVNIHNCEFMNNFPNYLTSYASRFWLYNFICTHVLFFFPPDFWYFLNASLFSYRDEHAYITPEWGISVGRAESPSCLCTCKYCNLTHLRIYITYVITNLFISILLLLKWYFMYENPWLFFCCMDTFKQMTLIHISIKCKCIKYSLWKIQFKKCSHIKMTF